MPTELLYHFWGIVEIMVLWKELEQIIEENLQCDWLSKRLPHGLRYRLKYEELKKVLASIVDVGDLLTILKVEFSLQIVLICSGDSVAIL
jgi:hypothetical protein